MHNDVFFIFLMLVIIKKCELSFYMDFSTQNGKPEKLRCSNDFN